ARLLTYRAILGELNENLIEARSGTEALKLLMEHDFALILLDVNMPGLDGFETANLIHQHPRFEKTPIIFITAINLSDLDRMRGYRLGAFDYVMVPIIPEILRSKVISLAELYRKRRELEAVNRHLAAANSALVAEKSRELGLLNESLRRANAELEARNAQLQIEMGERLRIEARLIDQDQRKDQFLAMLAHELRNPLASLVNAVNAFTLAAPQEHPMHGAMSRQLSLLVRLIDDLLDVARIGRGQLTIKQQPTTLNAIIDSAIETISPMLGAGTHVLNVQRSIIDIPLRADPARISQVFANLISNAVKYSDSGSTIDVVVVAATDMVEVAVVDHGIGLAPEQREWIFELFAQVDTTLERTRGGLGIGLTLARHIVELHAGQLLVQSDGIGRGSRFIVRLPRPVEQFPVAPPTTNIVRGLQQPCRALVVDDNADAADSLAMILQLLGHQTECVSDPYKVVDAFEVFLPQVVFLDIGMPGLSGYDVARLLRSNPTSKKATLVALTGWGQPEDRRRTEEAGFDHHIVKPADLDALRHICEVVAERDLHALAEPVGDADDDA
ncbi:MAG TPA: response regulator, partial [Rhodanobacteraceae bacterium]|nr:response regulator [Rhodanobacteraceae bacterium]